jgi:hypothetical protein
MTSVSLPVTRPAGQALVIGSAGCRATPLNTLQDLGYGCAEAEDPYAAMSELSRRPLAYRAVILSLHSLYKEELHLICATKRRFPHVEIWLTDTDGRQAALVESMRLGADGLLAEDGLHRIGVPGAPAAAAEMLPHGRSASSVAALGAGLAATQQHVAPPPPSRHFPTAPAPAPASPRQADRHVAPEEGAAAPGEEAVLTADELRALLREPAAPSQA